MEKFDWINHPFDDGLIICIQREIFENSIYETQFEVEEGDVVIDAGASIGPFTYNILHKNPKAVYCIDPIISIALQNNVKDPRVTLHKHFIGDIDDHQTKRFMTFVKENNIDHIDFLKTDCEGGEYSIFAPENFVWIVKNVKKITGEWHLNTPETKEKFREFRDLYLKHLPHRVFSVDGVDIKWSLWTENFISYYKEVIIHIDNR